MSIDTNGSYYIQNSWTNKFLSHRAAEMSARAEDAWAFEQVPGGDEDLFYIRSLVNREYLTHQALQMSSTAGAGEEWRVTSRGGNWLLQNKFNGEYKCSDSTRLERVCDVETEFALNKCKT